MLIELPFPAKILWPNGRTRNYRWRNAEFQKHKDWAWKAALANLPPAYKHEGGAIRLCCTVYPKTRHSIDEDNASAAMKAYQDGIAVALRVNDSIFKAPTIQFGEPVKGGKVVIAIGAGE